MKKHKATSQVIAARGSLELIEQMEMPEASHGNGRRAGQILDEAVDGEPGKCVTNHGDYSCLWKTNSTYSI